MQVQLVDRRKGLPPEEVIGRLSTGWLCVANVALNIPAVLMPGVPEVSKTVDVWMPPPFGAMMPQLAVVQALALVAEKGGDIITLDDLSKLWFNQPLRALIESLQQNEPLPAEEKTEDA